MSRFARYYLVDHTRGEPLSCARTRFAYPPSYAPGGYPIMIETAQRHLGYEASLFGSVEGMDDVVTQFGVIARGLAWDAVSTIVNIRLPFDSRARGSGTWPFVAIPPGTARTTEHKYLGTMSSPS